MNDDVFSYTVVALIKPATADYKKRIEVFFFL